jgi:hypothetical protein
MTIRPALIGMLATAFVLILVPTAPAATTLGSSCTANGSSPGAVFQVTSAADANYTVPSSGVITKWGSVLPPYPGGITARMKVITPVAGSPGNFVVKAESAIESLPPGANSFGTRIAVSAGDQIASQSSIGVVYCSTADPTDVVDIFTPPGDPAVGSTVTAAGTPGTNMRLALNAVLEPDADGDGYGDESQDQCPQSAARQSACPVVKLQKFIILGEKSLSVAVTSTDATKVTLAGSVKIGKKKVKLGPISKALVIGDLGILKLKYPSALKRAIQQSPRSTRFKLKLSLNATSVLPFTPVPVNVTLSGSR